MPRLGTRWRCRSLIDEQGPHFVEAGLVKRQQRWARISDVGAEEIEACLDRGGQAAGNDEPQQRRKTFVDGFSGVIVTGLGRRVQVEAGCGRRLGAAVHLLAPAVSASRISGLLPL